MRSPPGSLLVLRRANIYYPAMSTDLWSDSNPWRIGSNLFDTMAPVGLVESAAVSCSVQSDKISVFTRNRRTAQRTICESLFSSILSIDGQNSNIMQYARVRL